MEFQKFPKIARLNRNIVITEKLDGTNAAVGIEKPSPEDYDACLEKATAELPGGVLVYAQSRKRIIRPGGDNFGFAQWVEEHAEELLGLGEGLHFGEWWGKGIQRAYGLDERRFSLFNTARWSDSAATAHDTPRPDCCSVVPVLRQWGQFDSEVIRVTLNDLREVGSYAAPGYPDPEGIVVFHTHANKPFKVTLEDDEKPKSAVQSEAAKIGRTLHPTGGGQPSAAPLEAYA